MHSILEGVTKSFFKFWFTTEYSDRTFSLVNYMREIDSRLLQIQPPQFVTNAPRRINTWNLWRAHEFLHFMLYYSLPVLFQLLPFRHFTNLKNLVIFMEIILTRDIEKSVLLSAQHLIADVVKELASLYGKEVMLSGIYSLLELKNFETLFFNETHFSKVFMSCCISSNALESSDHSIPSTVFNSKK